MESLAFFSIALSAFSPFFNFTWENQFYPFPKIMREREEAMVGSPLKKTRNRWEGECKRGRKGGSLGSGNGNKCVKVSRTCPSDGRSRRVGGCEEHDNLSCFKFFYFIFPISYFSISFLLLLFLFFLSFFVFLFFIILPSLLTQWRSFLL